MTNIIPFLLLLLLVPLVFLAALLWGRRHWEHEPAAILLKTFLWGAAAVFPLLLFRWLTELVPGLTFLALVQRSQLGQVPTIILLLVLIALAEEVLKHWALLVGLAESHHFVSRQWDGVLYGVSAAVGFSLIDNASFLVTDVTRFAWPDFVLFASRAVGFTLMHLVATGIFSFCYATAILTPEVTKHRTLPLHHFHCHCPRAFKLHIIRTHLLSNQPSKHGHEQGELVAEGLVLAIFLHAIYLLLVYWKPWGEVATLLLVPTVVLVAIALLDWRWRWCQLKLGKLNKSQ